MIAHGMLQRWRQGVTQGKVEQSLELRLKRKLGHANTSARQMDE